MSTVSPEQPVLFPLWKWDNLWMESGVLLEGSSFRIVYRAGESGFFVTILVDDEEQFSQLLYGP